MKKVLISFLAVSLLSAMNLFAQNREEKSEWKRFFGEAGVEGCILVYDLSMKKYSGYNLKRARQEFSPASTFKLFSSLAALESGVLENADESLTWDGVDRGNPNWNRDQNLRDAIKFSTLWFYQDLVRRIGSERMQEFVRASNYGNRKVKGKVDRFWLDDGSLRITAEQQIGFLVRLHNYNLPFSRRNIDIVKEISILEKTGDYVIRGKMGWATGQKVAWLVGYLERGGKAYFFAMNLDTPRNEDAERRVPITRGILRDLGLID